MKFPFPHLIILSAVFIFLESCNFSTSAPPQKNHEIVSEKVESDEVEPDYNPEAKLTAMGIQLKSASSPIANYVNAVRSGNLIFLSGKGPLQSNGENITGKIGADLTIEQGYEAARITGINQLSVLKAELGNLNKVKRIVKVVGMVNCLTDFTDQPKVVNGYSDLMVEVFGERGKHARAAVGMGSLPGNIAIEVDMVVEVFD